jgi:hypothetical protein
MRRMLRAWCIGLSAFTVAGPGVSRAQPRLDNARIETRAVTDGLEREIASIAGRPQASWIAYRVPLVPGPRRMCCADGRGCLLEGTRTAPGVSSGPASGGGRAFLEGPPDFFVFARVENGQVGRIRPFTPDCAVDAGGMPIVWLDGVTPDESVAWLATQGKQGLAALALHETQTAVVTLIALARDAADSKVRSDALFWLGNRAGQEALRTITGAIENDPDTDVKKRAVFALTQMPDGVPRLIDVARTNRNRDVRRQAMFWLGQSGDPRAVDFFAEILAR